MVSSSQLPAGCRAGCFAKAATQAAMQIQWARTVTALTDTVESCDAPCPKALHKQSPPDQQFAGCVFKLLGWDLEPWWTQKQTRPGRGKHTEHNRTQSTVEQLLCAFVCATVACTDHHLTCAHIFL